jgi:phage terminase large subunit GpA-like protein
MVDDRRAMYNGFSDKGAHSAEWFEIAKNFLKLASAGDRREMKYLCNRCWNRRILSKYEMSGHIAKHEFMSNYLVWDQHGEVQAPAVTELDGSDVKDRMDDMI